MKIEDDLAILPSHDTRVQLFMQFIEQVFCYTSMTLFSSHFSVTKTFIDSDSTLT